MESGGEGWGVEVRVRSGGEVGNGIWQYRILQPCFEFLVGKGTHYLSLATI